MNKKTISLFMTLVFVFSLIIFNPMPINADNNINMMVGETKDLKSLVKLPVEKIVITNFNIVWNSSNNAIIKVTPYGKITAIKSGNAVITASLKTAPSIKTSFSIQVNSEVSSISYPSNIIEVFIGEIVDAQEPTFNPGTTLQKLYTVKSSNTNIVKVINCKKLKAMNVGTTIITATSTDGGHKATYTIKVKPLMTSFSLVDETIQMNVGEKYVILAQFQPEVVFDNTVSNIMSKKGIVSVTKNYTITALKEGTVTITMETHDGKFKDSLTINVISDVNQLFLVDSASNQLTTLNIKVGEKPKLKVTSDLLNLDSLKSYKIKWTSSVIKIASVSSNGIITGKSNGDTIITAEVTQESNVMKVTLLLHVEAMVTGITLDKTQLILLTGQSEIIKPNVSPENAFLKKAIWTSSNSKVVRVENGKITAIGKGNAVITATTIDGNFIATCDITVNSMVAGINLSETAKTVLLGETFEVKPVILPNSALIKKMTCTPSDSSMAKIVKTKDGFKITVIKAGTINLLFKTQDGGHMAIMDLIIQHRDLNIEINDNQGNVISKNY